MRRVFLGVLTIALMSLLAAPAALAQRDTAEADIDGKQISIDYGRPSLAGRDMLGQMQPGQVWRMGMNSATMLRTETPLMFGDARVEPGSYRLWARLAENGQWELILSSNPGWYDGGASDVAVVPFETGSTDEKVEQFTIEIETDGRLGAIVCTWDMLKLTAGFSAP
ncbi:MAG TPA: DUF2911 domain-containing protein [Acidobacteriota bacterium]|nr:DUF2911 domain-containing protein [Acidobacteriota bacterium]